jgi:ribosomal protein L11 methyltransferase
MPAHGDWFEIDVRVDPNQVDALSGALWAAGVAGIEERGRGADTTLLVAVQRDALPAVTTVLEGRATTVTVVAADAGLDAWREHARPIAVDEVVVVPAWMEGPKGAPVVVMIEPGRSFGSGSHVTTQLALRLLQRQALDGARVLDVGTGSGVLAITAAKLGAVGVVALDIDPAAADAASANAARNEVDDRIDVRCGSLDDVARMTFDLVIANITASVLVDLCDSMLSQLGATGRLLLSGILAERAAEVRTAYDRVRWTDGATELGWTAMAGVRSA